MSRNYDNWERLVAAVIRKEQLWKLFHEDSRSPSLRSEASSSTSSSFRYLDSPLHNFPSFSGSFHEDSRSPSFRYEASSSTSSSFQDLDLAVQNLPSFLGLFPYQVHQKLVFVSDFGPVFDFEDLLRAYAKVLGNGTFGRTYKSYMDNGITVVVKELKLVSLSEAEFKRHMELVQNIRHENIVELKAYFYSKDKKLMLYDHYNEGSVSSLLHGRTVKKRANLDWETRKRIALGAARGIAHIHTQHGGKLVHGNIKPSNILLDSQQYGCVSDFGLGNNGKIVSQASDVYKFGMLLLELLTRKSPKPLDIFMWVDSVKHKGCTAEVFDVDLLKNPAIEDQMVKMLQIGIMCVARAPDKRPKMSAVLKTIKDISRMHTRDWISIAVKKINKLILFDYLNCGFELEDLLAMSLGAGTFGTSYRVNSYENDVVAKRMKLPNLAHKELWQRIELIGKLSHENIVKLKYYYCSKNEQFLVYDYYKSTLLHGPDGLNLNWEERRRVAMGAARGISYIHTQDGMKLVHGNIKASNIFRNKENYGCVTDVGLSMLTIQMIVPVKQAAGYRAPEVTHTKTVSQASDVYSFGVVLLELVTGRKSEIITSNREVVSLVTWIQSKFSDKEQAIDTNLWMNESYKKGIVRLLQIAMDCVAIYPEDRPKMPEVVKMLEEISEFNTRFEPFEDQIDFPSFSVSFHEDSRSPSLRYEASSSTSSSFRYFDSSLHDLPSFSGSFLEDLRSPTIQYEASSSTSSSFRYLDYLVNNLPSFSGSFHEYSRSPNLRYEASSSTSTSFRYFDSPLHDLQPTLVFVSNSSPVFDFEELVRAYPKVLSNGKFKTTYKADMDNGVTVVVMQLKLLSVSESEFKRHMELIQNTRHENIVEVRAYFYSKYKKLVLYDHYGNGSVSDLLRGKKQANFDWETRKRIVLGAARGIAHIHKHQLVHGSIKASNILLDSQQYGCVSDFGLTNMISNNMACQASDVYNFGMLLLELLTRKFPKPFDIFMWVDSVKHKGCTDEVFDVDLLKNPAIEDQMVKMLQIGIICVARAPAKRPKMSAVLKTIEEISNMNTKNYISTTKNQNNKVVLFELEDFLESSATLLRTGTFGTLYEVTSNRKSVVVRRMKLPNLAHEELRQSIKLIRKLSHENIVTLKYYSCSKNEQFLVYDYCNDSVSRLLHGPHGFFKRNLNWEGRRRIAVGAARGISCIHTQDGMKLVHGNIKASNIFLNVQRYGCVADVGLSMLTCQMTVPVMEADGYHAPEVTHTKTVSQASDVYSFGVVLLELVTGKKSEIISNHKVVSLVTWIQSKFSDKEQAIDGNLPMDESDKKGIVQLLQIAMDCVAIYPEDRPKMPEVVKMLEEISKFNTKFDLEDPLEDPIEDRKYIN